MSLRHQGSAAFRVARVLGLPGLLGTLSATLAAQRPSFAVAGEWRAPLGGVSDTATGKRAAIGLRLIADGEWNAPAGWRAEVAYTQAHYDRAEEERSILVNENSLEGVLALRVTPHRESKYRPYGVAGPAYSVSFSCGVDSRSAPRGHVPCGHPRSRLGWTAGAGLRVHRASRVDWLAELRIVSHVNSAGGGSQVAIAAGVVF